MNKADIIDKVHEVVGGTRADAERAVEVSIAGLGIFATKTRNARTGRNPRTGESIDIPAMRVPKFRAAKALKDAVK
jgi:DNA-binding protein HU-beta